MSSASLRSFHRELMRWYNVHGRKDLPWRNTSDPYAIYISEVMLQQTQVKTVLERYYFPFLNAFPTLSALAGAPQDKVLQAWQGLGYYNRALNLHKAAKQSGGTLPADAEGLMQLSGVGRNTAHAVAAFAYHQPLPVMEANVRRVLSRIFALPKASEQELWERAEQLLDKKNPFDYNQAMMDIGATVCTRRSPGCGQCPAQTLCMGKTSPELYPAPKEKKAVKIRRKHIVIFEHKKHYYATPRSSRFLNGLHHFVESDADAHSILWQSKKYKLAAGKKLGKITQAYSHFTLEAEVWLLAAPKASGKHWYSMTQLGALPVSMAEQKIIKLLHSMGIQ